MKRCDLALWEHENGLCTDPDHAAAQRRRAAGASPWWPIVRGKDGGGLRDFLEGEPIYCGAGLLLQGVEDKDDDYGGYTLLTEVGVPVGYELDTYKNVFLQALLGGHSVEIKAQPGMRFRRPKRGGR